ncbi:hypothetical protein [Xenorhabdus hominickii]|uniref:Peptidase M10 metallopeptidase domain-containing protein n=1 Tax=Xenorhabdus hominickii TaxID=351679 RepID=A0A2G0QDV4_XENHO|nr:hypothetical protein [Xenorhabdus hominickii]AOM41484.1 hypothetical protein A9255_13405 [Xenorhabdus hominickii]PHM57415.1 hypothetical protein Xhom_00382 [Xenorhabdus hominickii]
MKLIKKIFIFILLITTAQAIAQTEPPDPAYTHIAFLLSRDKQNMYSAVSSYGGHIGYTLDNPQMEITYEIQGHSISIPLTPLVEAAAAYWNRQLGEHGLTIEQNSGSRQPNFIIRFVPPNMVNNVLYSDGDVAEVRTALTFEANSVCLDYYRQRYPSVFNSAGIFLRQHIPIDNTWLNMLRGIFGSNNRKVLLGNLLYTIILHEFGHAVGLSHPDNADRSFYPNPERGAHIYRNAIGVSNFENMLASPQPALMHSDQLQFLSDLHEQRGEFLTRNMIGLSDNENSWIQDMVNCHNLQRTVRFVNSLNCHKFQIIYPLANAMMPIYQTLFL